MTYDDLVSKEGFWAVGNGVQRFVNWRDPGMHEAFRAGEKAELERLIQRILRAADSFVDEPSTATAFREFADGLDQEIL